MKDSELKMRTSWTIDPIESFMDGKIGEQQHVLITAGKKPLAIRDDVFWNAGKRAFDTINSSYNQDVTEADIKEFFYYGPGDLIDLWNSYKSVLEPLIKEGRLGVIPFGSDEPIKEFTPLSPNSDGSAEFYKVEPFIRAIDAVFENSNVRSGAEQWPFDRDLVGAFFTLCNVDLLAAGVAMGGIDEHDYALVNYWFEKIDLYRHKKAAIEEQQEFLKRKKSQSMNVERHAKSNSARELVIDNWSKGPSEFPSAAKAGLFYTEWLEGMNHEYEPTTITNWIRKHAKDTGIKLK
ncbi:MAG: hypothetical protein GY740_15215 [Gammaproteobacteria bacterium]|nr:hypothetical protein [Gammaproteobacteria bacterium]